jgi:hypothetical protein
VILTDVIMPGTGGAALIEPRHPSIAKQIPPMRAFWLAETASRAH